MEYSALKILQLYTAHQLMHISFHAVSIGRDGLYLPACASQWQAGTHCSARTSVLRAGINPAPYEKKLG
jgi:hypothetical protein